MEPFVRAHADGLPAKVTLIHELPPRIDDRPILLQSIPQRAYRRKALRLLRRREWEWEITSAYLKAFRRARPDAVLAEFGQTGVTVLDACRRMKDLFLEARAIVAVSNAMQQRLISLGAPPGRVHCNPCGVDCGLFSSASPATAAPVLSPSDDSSRRKRRT